jgi:hypothetical protein
MARGRKSQAPSSKFQTNSKFKSGQIGNGEPNVLNFTWLVLRTLVWNLVLVIWCFAWRDLVLRVRWRRWRALWRRGGNAARRWRNAAEHLRVAKMQPKATRIELITA